MRGRFLRRIGCAFALLLLVLVLGSTALSWLIASATGGTHLGQGVLLLLRVVGLLVIAGGLAGIFVAARALRQAAMPVGDLLEAAGRVAEGDYSVRVEEGGPGEVQALAHAFNSMAAKLQADDEQRRNLLADVTHELRTPITVIQGNLEGMLDGVYPTGPERIQSILEETRTLSRVIDDLRTLSLAESGALKLQLEPVDAGELVADLAASFEDQAGAAGIDLYVEVQPGLPDVEIDPTRIREVLTNLVVNALRYTPSGGRIDLRCGMAERPSRAAPGRGERHRPRHPCGRPAPHLRPVSQIERFARHRVGAGHLQEPGAGPSRGDFRDERARSRDHRQLHPARLAGRGGLSGRRRRQARFRPGPGGGTRSSQRRSARRPRRSGRSGMRPSPGRPSGRERMARWRRPPG